MMTQEIFFKWDKSLIESKKWAALPKAAKSIFPVIAVHCNAKGECNPSQRKIADLSGRTEKTVSEGIKALKKKAPGDQHFEN